MKVVPYTQGVPGSHWGIPGGLGGAPSGCSSVPTAMDGADDISRGGKGVKQEKPAKAYPISYIHARTSLACAAQ